MEKAPDEETGASWELPADGDDAYRHVRLRCGDRVLSEADNWYLPRKLTPRMNRLLETSDMAFRPRRAAAWLPTPKHDAKLLWSPLDRDAVTGRLVTSELRKRRVLTIPPTCCEHRAQLTRADGGRSALWWRGTLMAVLDFPPAICTIRSTIRVRLLGRGGVEQ